MFSTQKKQKSIALGNYALKTTIGKGNSAVVKLANHVYTKQKVAIKMFDRSGLDNDKAIRLKREIDSMKRLRHPNIVQLYEIMETPKLICLVTEYASNGELYDYIINNKRLSEREARFFFKQIVSAVHYCHKQNIVHRDIKVENLLLDAVLCVKLADFGFSSTFKKNELMDTWCGSPPYSAPELYLSQLYDGPKIDIWSLGVVLYILVCRRLPFDARSFHKLRSQVVTGSYNTPFFLSEDCKQLIKGMLTVKSNERFNMDDIIHHKWFCVDVDANEPEELKNIVNQIENISINDTNPFTPDENVLIELKQIGIDTNLVLESIKNKTFDENEAMYYLIENKYKKNGMKYINNSETDLVFNLLPKSMRIGAHVESDEINSDKLVINSEIDKQTEYTLKNPFQFVSEHRTSRTSNTSEEQSLNNDNDEMDEQDNEIAKQYLSKYGGLRRHTIGTNPENMHKNDIMKSLECLKETKKNLLTTGYDATLSEIKEINNNNIINLSNNTYNISEDVEIDEKHNLSKISNNIYKDSFHKDNHKKLQESQECIRNNLNDAYNDKIDNNFCSNQYLIPPVSYGRRASDGGSNISLFNQYFSIRNSNCDSTSSQYSRGSITSGIPIESISSDEDEPNLVKSKKPRTRQDTESNQEYTFYRPKRDQSFDASSNSVRNRALMQHRGSEPTNHIDILLSNRTHLEQLYNQGLSIELHALQRENPSTEFDLRKQWMKRSQNEVDIEKSQELNEIANAKDIGNGNKNSMISSREVLISNCNNADININDSSKSNMEFRNAHIPDRLKTFSQDSNILDEKLIYQKLNPQSQNDLTNLLNVNLLNNKTNLSTNNLSSSSLHMIQEEQTDALSASTTPRLSQTSTTSNNSIMDITNNDEIIEEKFLSRNTSNGNLGYNKTKKSCSIDINDINSVTSVFFPFPFVTRQIQTNLYKIAAYSNNTNTDEEKTMETTPCRPLNESNPVTNVEQFVNCFNNFSNHNDCLHSITNSHRTNNNTKLDPDAQSQYANLVNYQATITPPTTGP